MGIFNLLKFPNRKKSYIELEVIDLLSNNNIKFFQQQKFNWLRYINPLELDFYLPEFNVAIECQGYQHFKTIDWFDSKVDNLSIRKERDIQKFNLCKNNGIKLLYYLNPKVDSNNYKLCKSEIDNYFEKIYTTKEDLLLAIKSFE